MLDGLFVVAVLLLDRISLAALYQKVYAHSAKAWLLSGEKLRSRRVRRNSSISQRSVKNRVLLACRVPMRWKPQLAKNKGRSHWRSRICTMSNIAVCLVSNHLHRSIKPPFDLARVLHPKPTSIYLVHRQTLHSLTPIGS
jgi:hypothetical protein